MMYNSSEAYLDWQYRLVSSLFWAPLTVFGVGGNLMVIFVVVMVRGMKTPTNCYLVSLAVADCLFFLSSTPVEFSSIHLPEDVFLFGKAGCSVLRFLPFLSMNASSLSITAFTIERYIGICHPLKARYICTVKRAQLIIVIIWISSVFYNSSWLFLTDLKPLNYADWPNAYQCTYSLNRTSYKTVFITDMLAFYWVPLLLYVVLYGSMARILVKAGHFGLSNLSMRALPIAKFVGHSRKSRAKGKHTGILSETDATIIDSPLFPLKTSQSNWSNEEKRSSATRLKMSNHISSNGIADNQSLVIASSSNQMLSLTDKESVGKRYSRTSTNSGLTTDEEKTIVIRNQPSDNLRNLTDKRAKLTNSRKGKRTSKESKAYYGRSLSKARVQVVKMLLVIVVCFALLWLPYRALVVYNSFAAKPWIEKWYLLFSKTMVMVNCAVNPILYNLMSGKFRNAFTIVFKKCCTCKNG